MTTHETEQSLITQRSAYNPRAKQWIWVNYRDTVPRYETQYETLFRQQQHIREDTFGESPYVYLKETVTDMLGMYASGTGQITPDWIRCRIIKVDRDIRRQGGYVTHPETTLEFTIDDPNFTVV